MIECNKGFKMEELEFIQFFKFALIRFKDLILEINSGKKTKKIIYKTFIKS